MLGSKKFKCLMKKLVEPIVCHEFFFIDIFLIKSSKFGKIGSLDKVLILLGKNKQILF